MKKKIKLAIVDDSDSYRTLLAIYLKAFEDFEIIIMCSNGQELIDALKNQMPDVVLLDWIMPLMNGIQTAEYLSKHHPKVKKIILTAHQEKTNFVELVGKGADGFLPKENNIAQIADAIFTVVKNQKYFVGEALEKLIATPTVDTFSIDDLNLTGRELQIIGFVCNGDTSKQIADKLCISKRTVDKHRTNVIQKTKSENIAGLTKLALKYGLIKVNDGKN